MQGSASASQSAPIANLKQLDEQQLTAALVGESDMPEGFKVEAVSNKPGQISYICNYNKKAGSSEHTQYAERPFVRGSGQSSEYGLSALRQYASVDVSKKLFDALNETLKTCTETDVDGTKAKVSVLPSESFGDQSIMVRLEAQGAKMDLQYVRVGPTFVQIGTGSLQGVSQNITNQVTKAQVDKYVAAASQ